MADREPARLWRYHKPPGLITTHKDPKGRPTVFERLPPGLPRVISIGRLDLTSEGLLLLTNDGALARELELPSSGVVRRYRARAFGRASQEKLDRLKDGITVEGMVYGPIQAHLDGGRGANIWITLELGEGKNREVRRVLEAIGLKVNRLIRTAYGPFELGDLAPGAAEEVPPRLVKALIAGETASPAAPAPSRVRGQGRTTARADSPRPERRRGADRPPPPAEPVLGSAFGRARGAVPLPQRGRIQGQRRTRSSPLGGSTAEGRDGANPRGRKRRTSRAPAGLPPG